MKSFAVWPSLAAAAQQTERERGRNTLECVSLFFTPATYIGTPHCHTSQSHITHSHPYTQSIPTRERYKNRQNKKTIAYFTAPSLVYPFTPQKNATCICFNICFATQHVPLFVPPLPLCTFSELVGNSTAFKVHKSSSAATATEVVC